MGITSSDIYERIQTLRSQDEEFCIVSVVRTENATSVKAGSKALVTRDGNILGFLGGMCLQRAVTTVSGEVLDSGLPRLIRVKPKEEVTAPLDVDGIELHKSSCPSGGTVDLFIEPMLIAPKCIICGASPVANALLALAKTMDYRTVLAAPDVERSDYPAADHLIDGFDLDSVAPTERDYIVVATQGKRDQEALMAALSTDALYVAMIGSPKKVSALKKSLEAKGLMPEKLQRLKGPAGLDIGAIEPEEIALSILGEIIQHRRRNLRHQGSVGGNDTS